jgi:antirestriction protein ArdC
LRHNGIPYKGINIVMLWSAAMTQGYACPLTFKQAIELGGHVRKGGAGELVVYANSITRTETDAKGEETEREIPYMKGYTVFNAEQCDGLPEHYYAKAEPPALTPMQRLEAADRFFAATGVEIRHGGTRAYYGARTMCRYRPSRPSAMPRATPQRSHTSSPIMRGSYGGAAAHHNRPASVTPRGAGEHRATLSAYW